MTKWKIIGIVFSLGLVLMGITLWRVDRFTFRDRTALIESQLSGLTSASALALSAEAQSLYGKFIPNDILNGKSDRLDWNTFAPYQAFFFTQFDTKGNRQLRLFLKDKTTAQTLNSSAIEKAIGILPVNNKTEIIFRAFSDSNHEKHVIYLVPNNDRWFGFVSSGDTIQSLIEKQKGRQIQMSIVNPEGVTIGHSTRDYVGSRSSDNPILTEILKANLKQGHGIYTLGQSSKVLANFEKIPGVAGYVISSIPQTAVLGNRKIFLTQSALLFLGVLFICLAVIYSFWLPIEKSLAALQDKAKYLASGNKLRYEAASSPSLPEAQEIDSYLTQIENQRILQRKTPTVSTHGTAFGDLANPDAAMGLENLSLGTSTRNPGPPGELSQKERLLVYQKVASAMGHEFRGPLTSILGFTQSILAKSKDPYIIQTADSILLQTRNARNMLDKLFLFSGDNLHPKKKALVESPLQMALKSLESTLVRKGVRIVKSFGNTTPFPLSADDLQRAFECILTNSMEAMERMSKKEISIKSTFDGRTHTIVISDTGEGIEKTHLEKIFDPFYTTRSFSNHMGLGLSVALGIIKEHGGNLVIESEVGKGTLVTITFETSAIEKGEQLLAEKAAPYYNTSDEELTSDFSEAQAIPMDVPKLHNKEEVMIEKFELERLTPKRQPSLEVNIDHLLEELPEKQQTLIPKIEIIETPPLMEIKPIIPSLSEVGFIEEESTPKEPPTTSSKSAVSTPKANLKKRKSESLEKFPVEIKRPERRV